MRKERNRIIEDDILPVEQTITGLADSKQPLLSSRLADLSDLNPEQLKFLDDVWEGIEPKRRRQIISRLVDLAEDNVGLNFDAIFRHRLKDQDEEVRSVAIEGLWENEETSLIEPLINLMEQDSSVKVQAAAALALGRFAMLAEYQKLPPDYTSRLSHVLLTTSVDRSKPIEVRRRVLEAVAPLSLPQVRQTITDAYLNGNHKLKISSLYAMGKNCDPRWLPMLIKELVSADAEVRYEAASACGELGEDDAVAPLIKLTDDADADVRLAAIQALGKIGGSEAKKHLQKCLNHPSEAVCQVAAQALHELEVTREPLSPHDLSYGELND
jgi:hypothetical protein